MRQATAIPKIMPKAAIDRHLANESCVMVCGNNAHPARPRSAQRPTLRTCFKIDRPLAKWPAFVLWIPPSQNPR